LIKKKIVKDETAAYKKNHLCLISDLLRRVANISKTEFRLQFEGFEEQHNSECDADRVVGEILSGIL
jgi:hypothetical protein